VQQLAACRNCKIGVCEFQRQPRPCAHVLLVHTTFLSYTVLGSKFFTTENKLQCVVDTRLISRSDWRWLRNRVRC
jgi:hypothetical protein